MNDFWNDRYAGNEFAYGKRPNEFVVEQLARMKTGRVLFPAEGEGRNAVYAALQGFDAFAFDPSEEGKRKALQLAADNNVKLDYRIGTYAEVTYPPESFDAVVLVFAHMPAEKRREWHGRMAGFLKPGGKLIIEGFGKEQLNYTSGGPPVLEMLFSEPELRNDFSMLACEFIQTTSRILDEGQFHKGMASLVQAVFVK